MMFSEFWGACVVPLQHKKSLVGPLLDQANLSRATHSTVLGTWKLRWPTPGKNIYFSNGVHSLERKSISGYNIRLSS